MKEGRTAEIKEASKKGSNEGRREWEGRKKEE